MKAKVYGLRSCDTVKAARAWLAARAVESEFHDFRTAGMPAERLDAWLEALGWEALLNRRGTTWRRLDDATRGRIVGHDTARELMIAQPSVLRRPVVEWQVAAVAGLPPISVGFDAEAWAARLASATG